jgi:hypothetical protein
VGLLSHDTQKDANPEEESKPQFQLATATNHSNKISHICELLLNKCLFNQGMVKHDLPASTQAAATQSVYSWSELMHDGNDEFAPYILQED